MQDLYNLFRDICQHLEQRPGTETVVLPMTNPSWSGRVHEALLIIIVLTSCLLACLLEYVVLIIII